MIALPAPLRSAWTLLFALSLAAGTADAASYHVASGGNDANDGLSPATAWRSIGHALTQVSGTAAEPDTILVGSGSWTLAVEGTFPIVIPNSAGYVRIVGSGEGSTVVNASGQDNWLANYTFDASGSVDVGIRQLSIRQARGGIRANGMSQSLQVEQVTFEQWDYTSSAVDQPAVRIGNHPGNVTLRHLTINGARSEVTNKGGGGLLIEEVGGNMLIDQVVMDSPDASFYRGGGAYFRFCNAVTISSLSLIAPTAESDGGGISLRDISGPVQIDGLTTTDATSLYGKGGALYANQLGAGIEILNADLDASTAPAGGGAIYIEGVNGPVTVDGLAINEASTASASTGSAWAGGGALLVGSVVGDVTLRAISSSETYSGESGGVVSVLEVIGNVLVEDLTSSDSESYWGSGGALSVRELTGELALRRLVIDHAMADDGGGAISIEDVDATTVRLDSINVSFSSTQWDQGGGISIEDLNSTDSLLVSSLTLTGNRAESESGGGLAIDLDDQASTYVHLNRMSLLGNASGDYGNGGGLFLTDAGTVDVTNSTFKGNWTDASGGYYDGGGLYAEDVLKLRLNNTVFMENVAFGSGGGLALERSNTNMDSLIVENSMFLSNRADGAFWGSYGGGIYVSQGPATLIRNNLIAGNFAKNDGGAVYFDRQNSSGELTIASVTMAYNMAGDEGSSIYNRQNTDVEVWNSIIWANGDTTRTADPGGDQTTIDGNTNSFTYYYSNVEQDGGTVVDGTSNSNEDPFYLDPESDDFAVVWGSPMLDNGAPYDPDNPLTWFNREPEPNGGQINIGYTPVASESGGILAPGSGDVPVPTSLNTSSSQAERSLIRNNWVFMGSPVQPDTTENLDQPQNAWGDDMNNTVPSWENQTWRFSRWTNDTDYGAADPYIGYLRYAEPEFGSTDVGDPPNIRPGYGYWFVYNTGAWASATQVPVDISLRMLPADPIVFELEPLPTGTHVNPAQTSGFNMMANPWPFPINWGDIRFSSDQTTWLTPLDAAAQGLIENYAKTWDHASEMYINKTGRIDPWEGFFVLVRSSSPVWMQFNPDAVSPTAPIHQLDELDEALDWSLLLTARRVDKLQVDYDNWIGVGPDLIDGFDKFDNSELAPLSAEAIFLRSRLLDPDTGNPTERLTYDFRSSDMGTDGYKAWLMEAWFYHDNSIPGAGDAYPIDVRIQWPTISSVPSGLDMEVYAFTGGPLDMAPANLLVDDMHQTAELTLHLDNAFGATYYSKSFWVVAHANGGLLQSPEEQPTTLPEFTQLASVSPNPFNAATQLRFDLAEAGQVRLSIWNMLGQRVATLVDGQREAGKHQALWDARGMASGVYFVRFEAAREQIRQMKKIVLVK